MCKLQRLELSCLIIDLTYFGKIVQHFTACNIYNLLNFVIFTNRITNAWNYLHDDCFNTNLTKCFKSKITKINFRRFIGSQQQVSLPPRWFLFSWRFMCLNINVLMSIKIYLSLLLLFYLLLALIFCTHIICTRFYTYFEPSCNSAICTADCCADDGSKAFNGRNLSLPYPLRQLETFNVPFL